MLRALAAVGLLGCGFTARNAAGPGDAIDAAGIDTRDGSGTAAVAKRKPITLVGSVVAGSHTDFPVWVDLMDAEIAASARVDGTDIFFTNAMGQPLDYEIAVWTPPHLQAWVRLPAIAHNTNTQFFVEYGDLAKAMAPNPGGTFKAFSRVYHLDDSLAAPTIVETAGSHTGAAVGMMPSQAVGGQLTGALRFSGAGTDYVSIDNPVGGNVATTITAWVNTGTVPHGTTVVWLGANTASDDLSRYLFAHNPNAANIGAGQYNDDYYNTNVSIEGAGWTYLAWIDEGGNKKNHLFVNGVEIAGSPVTLNNAPATAGTTGQIGFGFNSSLAMDGALDEVRIAIANRPPAWLLTEYTNQHAPATFYTVGPEELAP